MKKLLLFSLFNMKRAMLCFIFTYNLLLITYNSNAQYILYGTTAGGGTYNDGTIFSYNPLTNKETVLFNFNESDGVDPQGRLLYASDGLLYGFAAGGGANDSGAIFSFNPKTNAETVVISFNGPNGFAAANGSNELIEGKDSLLYGTTWEGGVYNDGVLYSYNIQTHKDSVRCNFNDSTSLGSNGLGPLMGLWQDSASGILYGVTEGGGFPGGEGVIYGFNPANNKLMRFYVGPAHGTSPMILTSGFRPVNDSVLYAMSINGGIYDSGTIYSFNIHSNMVIETFSFSYNDGEGPNCNELFYASNNLFYGCTEFGGSGYGVLFSFNPANRKETVLHTFSNTDGSHPQFNLVQDPINNLLYGVTSYGGSAGEGVLFSYDTGTSTYTKILDFTGINGNYPSGLTLVDTAKAKKDTGIGVSELIANKERTKVYPNPANTILNVELYIKEGQTATICLYNSIGEKVRCIELSSGLTAMPIGELPSGIYYYRITDKNGQLIKADKQMIMH